LVEITRTNGQAGIDWSRITIIIDGNTEGDRTCGHSNSSYGCAIYSGAGLTSTATGLNWGPGETISIKETSSLQNGEQGMLQVKILIDGTVIFGQDLIIS